MRAAPERGLAAVAETTVREVPLTAGLLIVRSLPALLRGRLRLPGRDRPLFELLIGTPGFLELPVPGLLAGGYAGCPWKLTGNPVELAGDAAEFASFDEPGFAKVTMHFAAEPVEEGCEVVTETRIHLTDEDARRAFARYWFVVRRGSDLIRRDWLRAARRRAESP